MYHVLRLLLRMAIERSICKRIDSIGVNEIPMGYVVEAMDNLGENINLKDGPIKSLTLMYSRGRGECGKRRPRWR
jgi:hypothetical protein